MSYVNRHAGIVLYFSFFIFLLLSVVVVFCFLSHHELLHSINASVLPAFLFLSHFVSLFVSFYMFCYILQIGMLRQMSILRWGVSNCWAGFCMFPFFVTHFLCDFICLFFFIFFSSDIPVFCTLIIPIIKKQQQIFQFFSLMHWVS